MQRRHFGKAMAEPVVCRAHRHIAAADVHQRNAQQRGGRARRKDLVPVAQYQHGVRTARGKILGKAAHGIADGARGGKGRINAELQNRNARVDGHAVCLDLLHGIAELHRKVCACHHKARLCRFTLPQLLQHRPQQPVFRPRSRNNAHRFFLHGSSHPYSVFSRP